MSATLATPRRTPALLVSYLIVDHFIGVIPNIHFRDWVLDSGAYTAHTQGTPIDLAVYTERCKLLLADPHHGHPLTNVFALDVIGDWRGSLKNTDFMWKAGVEAIPCYHIGEPWDVLVGMARDYPRIALGGMVGTAPKKKLAWVQECFSKVWPAHIHGFGLANKDILMSVPFATADATNWAFAPSMVGSWKGMHPKGKVVKLGTRKPYNLESEVEHFMRMERQLKHRWRKEMAEIGA